MAAASRWNRVTASPTISSTMAGEVSGSKDEVAGDLRLQAVRLMQYGVATDAFRRVADHRDRPGKRPVELLGDVA